MAANRELTGGMMHSRRSVLSVNEYFVAMLRKGIPNVEMRIYGNGRHPGDKLPDGSSMTGGLTHRNGIPFGTWQNRYIDWFRDLGFLQKLGAETKAADDIASVIKNTPRAFRARRNAGQQRVQRTTSSTGEPEAAAE